MKSKKKTIVCIFQKNSLFRNLTFEKQITNINVVLYASIYPIHEYRYKSMILIFKIDKTPDKLLVT